MADGESTLSIGAFQLDAEVIRDGFEKSIAVYEYPYVDGADTEDLGQRARRVQIRCWFIDDRYEEHKEFLAYLDSRDLFDLNHPQYGLLKGRLLSVSVNHDDKIDTAEIDLDFICDRSGTNQIKRYADVAGETEEEFTAGQQDLQDHYAAAVTEELGTEAVAIMAMELDDEQDIIDQVNDVSMQARNYIKKVDAWVNGYNALLNEVSNPANTLIALVDYPANLPGRVIGSTARTIERYALSLATLRTSPSRYLSSLRNAVADLEDAATVHDESFALPVRIAGSQRLAIDAAALFAEDEQDRRTMRRIEQNDSFDILGNYLNQEHAPDVMTVSELERSLNIVREYTQETIDAVRAASGSGSATIIDDLKSMVRKLTDHVDWIKLERDRMITVDIENELPLHLVCLKYGLSYRYAERLQAINSIPQPSFTRGEITVYAG